MSLNAYHDKLESDFDNMLIERGFLPAIDLSYHHVRDLEEQSENKNNRMQSFIRLAEVYTPASITIRTRSDRVSIHKDLQFAFKWDCKTSQRSGDDRDLPIEAMPLLDACLEYEIKRINYVFVCEINKKRMAFGASAHSFDYIPHRVQYNRDDRQRITALSDSISRVFSHLRSESLEFVPVSIARGRSGDPYFEVPVQSAKLALPSLDDAIDSLMTLATQ